MTGAPMTRVRSVGWLLLSSLPAALPAEAQLGGLIKKKAAQAAAVQSTGAPVAFDNVILELTSARIAKVVAGKNAGKKLASGPNAPAAIRKKLDAADAQQAGLYDKHVDAINAFDELRRTAESCVDSVLIAIKDSKQLIDNPAFTQKATQLSMAYTQAQARGDGAEMRRLAKELENLSKPGSADSAHAAKQCPAPAPPAVVKQWLGLKSQIDSLNAEIAAAEDAIRKAEAAASGMNDRQIAMACERARMYLERLKANKTQTGFTQTELDAIAQALKDLESACT
jgi:hypothetical protein